MSASSGPVARVVAAAGALVAACSLVTDFDASKIPPEGRSGAAGAFTMTNGVPAGGAAGTGFVAGMGGGTAGAPPRVDASTGGGNAGGAESGGAGPTGAGGAEPMTPPACDVATNQGCQKDELCCELGQGVTCRKTSLKECERCGAACPTEVAGSCESRTCTCQTGAGRSCSGKDAERFCSTGPPSACVGCRDASDCAGRADGKERCVGGQCAACDPAQANAGCTGKTPICDPATHTCKACTATPDDCLKPLVCTASGACGSCARAADCASPTSPICDTTSTECRPCASDAECAAGPKLPYCVSQTCSPCNPSTEAGCADPTKPDCRGDSKGRFACQPCQNDGHCAGHPGTPVCDNATGRCVVCAVDGDCTANPETPLCVNNVCVACDTSSAVALVADLRCALKPGGQPVCIRTGTQKGQCGACDPNASRGCNNNQLCCESGAVAACVRTSPDECTACTAGACNALLANNCSARTCQCGSNAACAGSGTARFCVGSPGGCAECRNDADCTNGAAPLCEGNRCVGCDRAASGASRCAARTAGTVCATSGALQGRCAACDPATSAGCTDATLNQCDPATATCADCIDGRGCAGTLDRCNTATHRCVDCDATGGCGDVPATPICADSACRGCASDAECAAAPASAGPHCAANGVCIPDSPCARNEDCTDGVHRVCVGRAADGGIPGHCRVCDPATSAGCATGQTCTAAFVCTG